MRPGRCELRPCLLLVLGLTTRRRIVHRGWLLDHHLKIVDNDGHSIVSWFGLKPLRGYIDVQVKYGARVDPARIIDVVSARHGFPGGAQACATGQALQGIARLGECQWSCTGRDT